jgi:hypothetical protein
MAMSDWAFWPTEASTTKRNSSLQLQKSLTAVESMTTFEDLLNRELGISKEKNIRKQMRENLTSDLRQGGGSRLSKRFGNFPSKIFFFSGGGVANYNSLKNFFL